MINIIWLKPNKPNTKYHAFMVEEVEEVKIHTSLCNSHHSTLKNNGDYNINILINYNTVSKMGITENELINKYPQHCCKKCLISYKHHIKGCKYE